MGINFFLRDRMYQLDEIKNNSMEIKLSIEKRLIQKNKDIELTVPLVLTSSFLQYIVLFLIASGGIFDGSKISRKPN